MNSTPTDRPEFITDLAADALHGSYLAPPRQLSAQKPRSARFAARRASTSGRSRSSLAGGARIS